MCVTNVYVDRFPDGKEVEFRQTAYCQYAQPARPCQKLSVIENPVRRIQFGEPTTEYIMTSRQKTYPNTPPRSAGSSHHRHSAEYSSEDGRLHRRKSSKRRSELPTLKPTRTHRKERIVIVDAPPTPRTPPQTFHNFTAPSSPANTPARPLSGGGIMRETDRRRPIIVDERPLASRARSPSRSQGGNSNRNSFQWDSPSSSHASFDSRARREAEELERRIAAERDERNAALEAARRREQKIREQDEEIRRRPVVPIPILKDSTERQQRERERERQWLRPVVDQSEELPGMMGHLTLRDERSAGERAIISETEVRRRMEARDRAARLALQEREEEEMKRRLRERQMPKRRFSVGPGSRRHRVLYDDGVYRWE